MSTTRTLLLICALIAWAAQAQASIIGMDIHKDTDDAINCIGMWASQEQTLHIDGKQFWSPGHMEGTITTDTALDPTITVRNTLVNNTSFSWTGFHINVGMSSTFTIPTATVYTPGDWLTPVIQQPTWNSSWSKYVGQIDYSGGTAVQNNQTLDFSYNLTFDGQTSYSYCQEMIPTPEPGAFMLLAAGAMCAFMSIRLPRLSKRS